MNKGICVYVEHQNGALEETAAELIAAANGVKKTTGEDVVALVVATDPQGVIARLGELAVDQIVVIPAPRDVLFQDDVMGKVLADALKTISPSCVLVPATSSGKSLLSRTAAVLGCGLTADCTDIGVGQHKDDSFFLKQNKPSYGDNVMVSIVTRKDISPQMLTIRPGVFLPDGAKPVSPPKVTLLNDLVIPQSKIKVLSIAVEEGGQNGILSAEVVVVGGRGALEEDNLPLLKAFAEKLGAPLAGTRPLADTEIIAFEDQIGQTGCTIRPKICLSFGVSGAIQHVEGIKDTQLYIAINPDETAPIYNYADYGVAKEMKGILECCLEKM